MSYIIDMDYFNFYSYWNFEYSSLVVGLYSKQKLNKKKSWTTTWFAMDNDSLES